MNCAGSKAEKIVNNICRESFLSLWSYANPLGKNNKELCDALVVCGSDIIIISVKDIEYKEKMDPFVDFKRWTKKAIDSSFKQIYGAEKWIQASTHIIRNDGSQGITLPDSSKRKIYRVAVAFGGKGQVSIGVGDFGKGFVHVFTEKSLDIIFRELDTTTDFTEYLSAKEKLNERNIKVLSYGEENLLSLYLFNNRSFPSEYNHLIIENDLWDDLNNRPEYRQKKELDKISYIWDNIIEHFCHHALHDSQEFDPSLSDTEFAIRTMALENRFSRRILGKTFSEFMELASQKKVRSRMMMALSGVVYVFLANEQGINRKHRESEIALRCFVARGSIPNAVTIVGLATEIYDGRKGFSFDLYYLNKETWTDSDQEQMEKIKQELALYTDPVFSHYSEDEYPL